MKLYEVKSTVTKDSVWERIGKPYHYSPEMWSNSSRVFIAIEIINGTEQRVGMSAALPQSNRAWRSHKVVVLPRFNHLWRAVADAQAQLFLDEGKRYYCNAGSAPPELIAYRDDPASGWVPTTSHGRVAGELGRANSGGVYNSKMRCANAEGRVVSHEYVGLVKFEADKKRAADIHQWILGTIQRCYPHGMRYSEILRCREDATDSCSFQYGEVVAQIEAAQREHDIVLLPSKLKNGDFSVHGDKRFHLAKEWQCDWSCHLCNKCCIAEHEGHPADANCTQCHWFRD